MGLCRKQALHVTSSAAPGVAAPWVTWGRCLGSRGCAALQEAGLRGLLSPTGLCAPGDLWPAQPVCVTGGFGCALESGGPATLPPPAAVPSSFIDWNATCEGQFPSVYCPLELNDFNAFPEGKAVWTVPATSFYSQKVRVERACVLRALTTEKVPLRVIFQLSAEPSRGRSTLALCNFIWPQKAC